VESAYDDEFAPPARSSLMPRLITRSSHGHTGSAERPVHGGHAVSVRLRKLSSAPARAELIVEKGGNARVVRACRCSNSAARRLREIRGSSSTSRVMNELRRRETFGVVNTVLFRSIRMPRSLRAPVHLAASSRSMLAGSSL
jgi:hypothetical protein